MNIKYSKYFKFIIIIILNIIMNHKKRKNTEIDSNKQPLITSFFNFEKEKEKEKELSWYCIECGVDMGPNNPRQFCGKYMCFNYGIK